ncbi:hypothetical protein H5410_064032 [Solanum commersonii]|uniref:Uncharacterized protein n=1 Tax=Solanum commersonii TaxID=4109 RepID=A0A9J5W0W2_SOLCO|nr:hypothetical protein H5410_064032 [Solanum commersonii]
MRVHADGRRGKWWLKLSSLVVAATARRAPDSQTLIARLRARSDRDPSGEACSATDRAQVPWKGSPERVRAPSCPDPVAPRGAVYESGCLGMQPQSGGKFRPRLNTGERPIANKYREGKMKRTLKRESKSA